ncbi:hypothetical protein TNIN_433101 [Trichonephila inaurata madagascariensis]|uniref:Uncharacterized protein n=1 Tax=Trichonephila inaurata madagascariensis TaxID=2747483 RepID=A0A8X6YHJ2_9ARAC|nr:hypothetical protein TNIN_433101 [Trichonephila inaurata madagascariensis]
MNAVIAKKAQIHVVRADVVEGQSVNDTGTFQITLAFGQHEMGEMKVFDMEINDSRHGVVPISKQLVNDMFIRSFDYYGSIKNSQLVRNPAILRVSSNKGKKNY